MTITVEELIEEVGALGHFGIEGAEAGDPDYEAAKRAVRAGLNRIQILAAWDWLKATSLFDLVAGQRNYAFPADLFRFDLDSFYLVQQSSAAITPLRWQTHSDLDDRYAFHQWRLVSASFEGMPDFITRMGNEFWLVPKPTTEIVGDGATVEFVYYRNEPSMGNLYLPEAWRTAAVHAALAEGLKNRDDSDQAYYEELFVSTDRPNLLSISQGFNSNGRGERVESSEIAGTGRFDIYRSDIYYRGRDYGDGY